MRVLFLSPEVAPFSKTGGLADVAQVLPATLASMGHEVRVVTPLYASVNDGRLRPLEKSIRLRFPFGEVSGDLHSVQVSKQHRVIFLEQPNFYNRAGLYQEGGLEYPDNHRRFAFFSIGALAAAQVMGFVPDIIHLNDWQSGLAAVALARGYEGTAIGRAKRIFTIHNLAYQGLFPATALDELGIPPELFTLDQLEFYRQLSFIKGGLVYAHALTTVSRKYAQEIQMPALGCGLDGLLRKRRADLHGILNGVNYAEWTPSTDRFIPHRFNARDLSGKERNKVELLKAFGLSAPEERTPLFGMVSRVTPQKGIDILAAALPQLLEQNIRVVLLGSGEPSLEDSLRMLAKRFPQKAAVKIGFDPRLAHWVEAGSDFFLMPSRYEPCGLNQMYSLRFGTLPIVRATGGLDDTVQDVSEPNGTGFKFQEYSAQALAGAMLRAISLYQNPSRLRSIRVRGMKKDFSWRVSTRKYNALYRSLVSLPVPSAQARKRASG